jgi:single-strand DNA-binding protein
MYAKITIVGRLGRDPEMKYSASGMALATISVATTSRIKDEDVTTWWRVTCFGKTAENVTEYLSKGAMVLVEGRLNPDPETGSPRMWEKDGKTYTSYEVSASDVRFLSPKGEGKSASTSTQKEVKKETTKDPVPWEVDEL